MYRDIKFYPDNHLCDYYKNKKRKIYKFIVTVIKKIIEYRSYILDITIYSMKLFEYYLFNFNSYFSSVYNDFENIKILAFTCIWIVLKFHYDFAIFTVKIFKNMKINLNHIVLYEKIILENIDYRVWKIISKSEANIE